MSSDPSVDDVTFEVLRHRLWQINDEAGETIKQVSGSPIATEAYDFNTTLLDKHGEVISIGPYVILQAAVTEPIVKHILEEFEENPGIQPGDMFICSDPYYGALHQNDVTCVAPVHHEGKLIGWSGCTIHQVDVGGPVAGGYAVGAENIHEEPPVIPPLKIVERGEIRNDIETDFLRRSRHPHLLGLDFRAMVAANNVSKSRMLDLVEEYGPTVVEGTLDRIQQHAETRFRSRLRSLPNGTWRHVNFLDHDGLENKIYTGVLEMAKEGETLRFDFNRSSEQAPALINCTKSGLRGGVINAVLPLLCFDMPWAPGGIWNAIRVECEEGTIYNAEWPAGVCMGSIEGARSVFNLASVTIGKMMAASEEHREKVMASWCVPGAQIISGTDQEGKPFGTMLLDSMAGGGAASAVSDGLNTASYLSSMDKIIPNVEVNEYLFPILYMYRKISRDSGGPGKYKGGEGGEHAFIPHDTEDRIDTVFFSHGVEQPETVGLFGGYPANQNLWVVVRESDVRGLLADGTVPTGWEQLEGEVQHPEAKSKSSLGADDLSVAIYSGGGGYGDPLQRNPEDVLDDVEKGYVSRSVAEQIYGVVINENGSLDSRGTEARRETLRSRRTETSAESDSTDSLPQDREGARIAEYLELRSDDGEQTVHCTECGHRYGSVEINHKTRASQRTQSLQEFDYLANPHNEQGRFVLRKYACPECGVLFSLDVLLESMEPVHDIDLTD